MTRKFHIEWVVECDIELDEEVIDRVDDEWRAVLYGNLNTPGEIAEHIAYNLVMNNAGLSILDGWADMRNDQAKVISQDTYDWSSTEIIQALDDQAIE